MKPVLPNIDPASAVTPQNGVSHAATTMNLPRSAVTQTIERLEKFGA